MKWCISSAVAGCLFYLTQGRFTWRHDSVLNFLATSLQVLKDTVIYADLPDFKSPSIITGESYRSGLLISNNNCLYVLELSVGFESNLKNNIIRKKGKYKEINNTLRNKFKKVEFINLLISALRVFAKESFAFQSMLSSLGFEDVVQKFTIRRIINITIRSTYYILCCRNKPWSNPELIKY